MYDSDTHFQYGIIVWNTDKYPCKQCKLFLNMINLLGEHYVCSNFDQLDKHPTIVLSFRFSFLNFSWNVL